MATLEVHDGRGRVEYVSISRDQPLLFGSSEKCDLVLDGAGILPFHGRVRWKTSRFKADASPEAGYLLINGHKMATASFRQGDEIQVGPCRIFMLAVDEDLPQDDKTRIQPAPVSRPAPAATAPTSARPKPLPRRGRMIEREDWAKDLEVAPPSVEAPVPAPRGAGLSAAPAPSPAPQQLLVESGWRRLLRQFGLGDAAPGQERIITSPLVFGLAIALTVLVILGVVLRGIIAETTASRLYQRAVESLDDGDYRNAIRRFDEYLATGHGDAKALSRAKVFRALANVRQYTSTTGASWSNALEAEREMVDSVGKEPAYRDSSTELAELVLKTGESLADRAKLSADGKVLAEAESAVALHAKIAGEGAEGFLGKSKLPGKLAEARGAVRKASTRVKALAAMDAALKAGSSDGVYSARDALVREYADLAGDKMLVERLTKANDLVRRAVAFDPSRRPAETTPHPEPLGPPTSLVLRASASEAAAPAPAGGGPIVFALTDGFASAVDGLTGAPLWQVPVGLASPFPPVAIPGGTTVLVFDSRHDELDRIDSKTGALVWRQPLGERVVDPPLVLGNQLIQATPGGKVLFIDLATGELRGTLRLGLPLARTPASDEAGQFLYVLAERDCLFVLTRDPAGCSAVEYLGHAAGSLPCAPARLGRFLVIPENHNPTEGRWRVCVLDEDGARVRPVQQVAVPDWTWGTPASSGGVIWSTGDRGGITAFAIGDYDARDPFRLIARLNPESQATGPAFALARSEEELWLSSGRPARYDLDTEKAKINRAWSVGDVGASLGPLQVAGQRVVLTQQFAERPGVLLLGVDPQTGAVAWRTVLGAPWTLSPEVTRDGDGLTTLEGDGGVVVLPKARLASGGFVEASLPRPGKFHLPEGTLWRVEGEGLTVIAPGPKERHLLVRSGRGEFRRVELPVAPAAVPLFVGRDLLLPGGDGRVYLIDPTSGESRAEPYVPPFDRDHPTRWRPAVHLDGDALALVDESGKVRRLVLQKEPRPRLVATAEATLGKEVLAGPASTGGAVVAVTVDGRVRSLAARDLSPVGAWPLTAALAMEPVGVSGRGFIADLAGGVLALGGDGQRLWSITLRDGVPLAGPPAVGAQSAWFLARDGRLERRALGDGTLLENLDLGILPAGGLRSLGDDLAIPVGNSTIRLLSPNASPTGSKP